MSGERRRALGWVRVGVTMVLATASISGVISLAYALDFYDDKADHFASLDNRDRSYGNWHEVPVVTREPDVVERALKVMPPEPRTVASTFLGARWGLSMGVAVAALLLAVAAGARRTPVFVSVFLVASFASIAFLVWAEPSFAISQELSLNPVVRLVMGTVVAICLLTALMLEGAWNKAHGRAEMNRSSPSAVVVRGGFRGLAWGIVVAAIPIYPVSAALGIPGPTLPGGTPSFPGASR